MIGCGVIGYGYWGPNLARNIVETEGAKLAAVCDARPERLSLIQARYPGVKTYTRPEDLIADKNIPAVIIATPVASHFALAMLALKAGKHVLVEKPMACSSSECLRLIEEADKRGLVLMVDHTFAYTGAVAKMRDLIRDRELGKIYYYDSVRVNLGLFQKDVSVVWDLAVHDLSIMDYVLPERPVAVSATGMSHVDGSPDNVAYLTLFFASSLIAHVHVNWLAPVKVRRTLVGGNKKMIVYDDLDPIEKVKVYDKGVSLNQDQDSVYKMLVGYRIGDMWAPKLDDTEALKKEMAHFVNCIKRKQKPITDGEAGLRVVRVLEATTKSMKKRGSPVDIKEGTR